MTIGFYNIMKQLEFKIFILLLVSALLSSCYKMAENAKPMSNINYNAVYVVNGESNSISVIDVYKNEVTETIPLGTTSTGHDEEMSSNISWPHHISINAIHSELALGIPGKDLSNEHSGHTPSDGKIALINAKTAQLIATIDLPTSNYNSAYSPDGSEIWTAQVEEEGKVLIFDAVTFRLKKTIAVGKEASEVTFSSNGLVAFVANGGSNSVTVISATDNSIVKTLPVGKGPAAAWPAQNGKMYVDNEIDKTVSVIDVPTLVIEETFALGFKPGMVQYNAVREELWVTDSENGRAVYYGKSNGSWKEIGSITTGEGSHGIAFTKDQKRAYVTNEGDGTVSLISVEERLKIKDIKVGKKPTGLVIKE